MILLSLLTIIISLVGLYYSYNSYQCIQQHNKRFNVTGIDIEKSLNLFKSYKRGLESLQCAGSGSENKYLCPKGKIVERKCDECNCIESVCQAGKGFACNNNEN